MFEKEVVQKVLYLMHFFCTGKSCILQDILLCFQDNEKYPTLVTGHCHIPLAVYYITCLVETILLGNLRIRSVPSTLLHLLVLFTYLYC